jgi:7-cyano-7-deazaguanine synthase
MNTDARTDAPADGLDVGYPSLAVLVSGGLDSAILVAEAAAAGADVHPLYVHHGLYWETVELASLRRYLEVLERPALRPLQVLELPVGDLYGAHWSVTGRDVPDERTPDAAVFLPGRNVLLLAKAMLWCHLHGVPAVALASLRGNPFPDATPEFFRDYQAVVNRGIGGAVAVLRPYAELTKAAVMRRGRGLPLGLTFSCLHPVLDLHCGACNKCAERRQAFAAAGLGDPTSYYADGARSA